MENDDDNDGGMDVVLDSVQTETERADSFAV